MSLLTVAAALLATVPAAALALVAGMLGERLSRDPRLRDALWTAAFLSPVAVLVLSLFAPDLSALAPRPEPSASVGQVSVTILSAGGAAPGRAPLDLTPWAAALVGSALAGALFRLGRSILGARRMERIVRRAQPLERAGPSPLPEGAPHLLVTDEVDQPLLAGLRRPTVLLPRAWARTASPSDLAMVCAHEAAHARRGDNLRLAIEKAVEGLLWFNPFLAPCRRSLWAAREEVCDLAALADAPPPVRRAYASALVHALRLSAGPEPHASFTGARSTSAMRLDSILNPPLPASLRARVASAGLVGVALLASAATATALEAALPSTDPAPAAQTATRAPVQRAALQPAGEIRETPPLREVPAPRAPRDVPRAAVAWKTCSTPNQTGVRECVPATAALREVPAPQAPRKAPAALGGWENCSAPNQQGVRECVLAPARRTVAGAVSSAGRGSLAQGGPIRISTASGPVPAVHITTSAPQADPQATRPSTIEITAQKLEEMPGLGSTITVYTGDPKLRGVVGPWRGPTDVRLHGKSLTPGFDLQQLDGRVVRVESLVPLPGSGERPTEINITLSQPVACCLRPAS